MWKDTFYSPLETMDFGKIFMRQSILLGHFYATGYRMWRALPHIPVTSLVKYLPQISALSSSSSSSSAKTAEAARRLLVSRF